VVLRLATGILAAVFLPLGLAFVVVGLVVDKPDRGEPEAFLYIGAGLAVVGLAFVLAFGVLWRKEAARRRRRREGLRTKAEVVRAEENWSIRVNDKPALNLTVRFAGAGTSDGTVTGTFFRGARYGLAPGDWIDIVYEPADPSNFEPVSDPRWPV